MEEFSLEDLGIPVERDLVGAVLSGCAVERLLGKGGMGAVYLARRPSGEQVVVKVLAPELANKPLLLARFSREWAALARIDPPHRNVVAVHHVALEDEVPHIVMEYVEGVSLLRLLQEHGAVQPARAAQVALDVARALTVVHDLGMVHRDVKPANVLVDPSGSAKLVDFGLAKDTFRTSLTKAGQILGTAFYMSPELWTGGLVDARSDVFALGATLYHLLAGRPPFRGEDVHEIADQACAGDYPPLRELAPQVPPELERLIARMLIPSLRYRYTSMSEVVADLERVLAGGRATLPCLIDPQGGQTPLLGDRRLTIGRAADCAVRLDHPSVAERHAQLRREDEGFTVRALRGTQVQVEGEEVRRGGRLLADGERIRVGELILTFRDPNRPRSLALPREDARTGGWPAPLVDALARAGDPRVAAHLIEELAPDPVHERWLEATLGPALGAEAAAAAVSARRRAAAAQHAQVVARLSAVTGERWGSEVSTWLAWWTQVQGHAPAQLTDAGRPRRRCALVGPEGEEAPPSSSSPLLIGSDPRCQLRFPGVARLELSALLLHRRVLVRAAGAGATLGGSGSGAAFFEPGQTLPVGSRRLECRLLELEPARRTSAGWLLVDRTTFEALVALGHPCALGALAALVEQQRRAGWVEAAAREACPQDAGLAARLAASAGEQLRALADLARRALGAALGPAPGDDWRAQLAARGDLGAQLAPWGWLEETR
ncbi:MAG TPA: hypothetical protein DEA08_33550 [Planctomycetes bacterium]|nr:hypothetical protein [Planctomycetota bacterium]